MKSISTKLAFLLLAGGLVPAAHAVNDLPGGPGVRQLNLHDAATRIAVEQGWLHWFMLITCLVIFIVVFSVMFYSIWKHRKSVGHPPASFHEARMPSTSTSAGRAVACRPWARPEMMFVAWPVCEAAAVLRTGPKRVEV